MAEPPGGCRVPTSDGTIGSAWARGRAWRPDPGGGLIPDLRALGLNPSGLDPRVVSFYAETGRHRLDVTADWHPLARPMAWLWRVGWALRWGQLALPLRGGPLGNALFTGDDGTWWVRASADGAIAYIGRFDAVEGRLRVVFPVPGGAWIVVLTPEAHLGGVRLHEHDGYPGGSGLYVTRRGTSKYIRWIRECIELLPTSSGLVARHTFAVFGQRVLTLGYRVPDGSSGVAR